jgi:quercetin dioxygenase-like cupin family protein
MAEKHSYLKTHHLSGTGLIADALDEAVDLLEKAQTSASGRAAKTLVKNGPLRLTLIAMRKGAEAKRHHVEGPATIQVMRGRMRITTPRGREDLRSGALYALGAGVEHSHTALTDFVALLTIAEPQPHG